MDVPAKHMSSASSSGTTTVSSSYSSPAPVVRLRADETSASASPVAASPLSLPIVNWASEGRCVVVEESRRAKPTGDGDGDGNNNVDVGKSESLARAAGPLDFGARHMLNNSLRLSWTDGPLPVHVTLRLPKRRCPLRVVGFRCVDDEECNPGKLDLLVSSDGLRFALWKSMVAPVRGSGARLFSVQPIPKSMEFIKLVVGATVDAVSSGDGAAKQQQQQQQQPQKEKQKPAVVINRLFLFEEDIDEVEASFSDVAFVDKSDKPEVQEVNSEVAAADDVSLSAINLPATRTALFDGDFSFSIVPPPAQDQPPQQPSPLSPAVVVTTPKSGKSVPIAPPPVHSPSLSLSEYLLRDYPPTPQWTGHRSDSGAAVATSPSAVGNPPAFHPDSPAMHDAVAAARSFEARIAACELACRQQQLQQPKSPRAAVAAATAEVRTLLLEECRQTVAAECKARFRAFESTFEAVRRVNL